MNTDDRDRNGFYVLHRTYSDLYKKTSYLRPGLMVFNRITEYDIRSANISSLRNAKKIRKATAEGIQALSGKDRKVIVGKMEKLDPELKKTIAAQITKAKREFFMGNGIQDDDVLSIKNDAIFIIGRKLRNTVFGEMEFRPKNVYAGYLYIEKLEIYYDKEHGSVTIKGINDDILDHPDHRKGMLSFLTSVMSYLEMDRRDALRRYLIEFSEDYKAKRLPKEYYREMNRSNIYRTNMEISEFTYCMSEIADSEIGDVNGVYNYTRFVLPIIQQFI